MIYQYLPSGDSHYDIIAGLWDTFFIFKREHECGEGVPGKKMMKFLPPNLLALFTSGTTGQVALRKETIAVATREFQDFFIT